MVGQPTCGLDCLMAAETLPKFTSHNVLLDDGTLTFPTAGYTMDRHMVTLSVKRLVHTLYPDGLHGKTIIDVGCLEGGFTTEFARMGLTATGLEVRDTNYGNCLYVRERVNLPNLKFIQGDAVDIAKLGQFDIFFVSGLLYHLDRPRQFLEEVASNCRKALIIWTHVTQAEDNEASRTYTLSELCENEGLLGRWYEEHGDIPRNKLNQLKWASWNNEKSFWVQKEYLLQTLKDIGFDLVFEQFDCMDDIVGDMMEGFYHKIDRVLLTAIKSGLPLERPAGATERRVSPAERRSSAAMPRNISAELAVAQSRALLAEQKLANAEAMLRAVHESTSWRITAPLRGAASLLRKKEAP
jgi:SAM-dependent methyltransferase